MSCTVEAEVSEQEIIDAIAGDPELLIDALRKLAARKKGGEPYRAALSALVTDDPDTGMSAETWANAFAAMGSLDQDRALYELKRAVPLHAIARVI